VYQDTVQDQQYFNRYESASGDQRAEYFFAETTNSRTRAGFKRTSASDFATADNTNQSGVWYHLASTYDTATNTQTIYKNGVSVASAVFAGDSTWATNYAEIGRAYISGGATQVYSDCKIDDLRSFTRVLTQDEIAHLASDRGVQGTPIVGLGDEIAWYCPSIEDSPRDLTNGGNDGTYNGGMGTIANAEESGQRAYDFDGTDDFVDLTGANFLSGRDAATVSAWVYLDNFSDTNVIYHESTDTGSGTSRLVLFVRTDGQLRVGGRINDGDSFTVFAQSAISSVGAGQWYHVSGVCDFSSGDHRVYLDGTDITSTSASTTGTFDAVNPAALKVGTNGANWFDGLVDDIRIYDRALTTAEVAHLASGRGVLGPAPTGLGDEAGWWCPTLSGNASDLSGNGNAGGYQGGMGVTHYNDGTAAFEFDGTDDHVDTASFSFAGDFAFGGWARIDSTGDLSLKPGIFSTPTSGASWFVLRVWTLGQVNCDIRDANGNRREIQTTGTYNDDQWHHLLANVDRTNDLLSVYIDGESVVTGSLSTFDSAVSGDFDIGLILDGSRYFTGDADDIRIYDRALTSAEIAHLASERGVQGAAEQIPLDYLWSPTQGPETAYGTIANMGTAGTQDLSPRNNSTLMTWVSDTDKNGLYAVDMEANDHYDWESFSTAYSPVTTGIWIKCDDADESGYIMSLSANSSTLFLAAEFRSGGNIRLWCGGLSTEVSDGGITKTDWNHIALTYDGTNGHLFLNGVEIASRAATAPSTYTDFQFGTGGASVFGVQGRMDGMFADYSLLADADIAVLATDRTYPENLTPGQEPSDSGFINLLLLGVGG
jgi:hypothetical protein